MHGIMMHVAKKRNMRKIHPKDWVQKWKIVRGDTVRVIAGKDKGKEGRVLKCFHKHNTVLVEGVNLVKKHVKSSKEFKGGIFTKESPLNYSNVQLIDPQTNKPTRVGLEYQADGSKQRISKKSGSIVPKPVPAYVTWRAKLKNDGVFGPGPKDTPASAVHQQTYTAPEPLPPQERRRTELLEKTLARMAEKEKQNLNKLD